MILQKDKYLIKFS